MKVVIFCALLAGLASPLGAESLRGDAFGVFDASADPDRMAWSGVVSNLGEPGHARQDDETIAPATSETVLIHFGEKSLARGSGVALIAAVILDAHGNLVSDGTGVTLRAEDGAIMTPSENGIAARPVPAGDAPGLFHAWAETTGAEARRQSPRVTYRVVPALPEQAAVLVAPGEPFRTEEMVSLDATLETRTERPGLLDGVSAQILLSEPQGGHSVVPGLWIGGQLHARLLTRDIDGTIGARLHLPYAASPEVQVVVSPVAVRGPLLVSATIVPELRAAQLRLGPLMTMTGHLLHDGSLAQVTVTDAAGRSFDRQAWTLDGLAEITVPSDALPFALTVGTPGGMLSHVVTEAEVER